MKGIDISKHNGVINFVKVKASGIDFAMIRAGYACTTDDKFNANITAAKAAGIAVGVYWFAYALNAADAIREADYCHKVITPYKIDLPVFYDFEEDTERYAGTKGVKFTPDNRTSIIKTFCDRIKALGHSAGIYTNPDYIVNKMAYAALKPYTLWLARWTAADGVAAFATVPDSQVDNSYNKVSVWQFGMGKVDGINGNVDIDYGYFDLPVIKTIPQIIAAVKPAVKPVTKPAANPPVTFKRGDKVQVKNLTIVGGVKRGITYLVGTFRVYYDTYDIIGNPKGSRVVIGRNGIVTAAVNAKNLEKIIK